MNNLSRLAYFASLALTAGCKITEDNFDDQYATFSCEYMVYCREDNDRAPVGLSETREMYQQRYDYYEDVCPYGDACDKEKNVFQTCYDMKIGTTYGLFESECVSLEPKVAKHCMRDMKAFWDCRGPLSVTGAEEDYCEQAVGIPFGDVASEASKMRSMISYGEDYNTECREY